MKPFSPVQDAAISGPITQPQYLVYVELDQPYYWSTYDNTSALGQTWSNRGIRIGTVTGHEASFAVENFDYRHTENALSGVYQRGLVRIYWAYPIEDSPYVEEGYWEDGYVSDVNEPIVNLMFEGIIASCPVVDYWLDIRAIRTPPRMFPFQRIRPPFANHLPPPGYIVEFDSQILRVEGGRGRLS